MEDAKSVLRSITERIRDQDNRATAHPIYEVQQRRRTYWLDPAAAESFCWIQDGEEVTDAEEVRRLDALAAGGVPVDAHRVGYRDEWEYVTPCFTEAGAQEYIDRNRHNLIDPRIYVGSGYRNEEWIAVRSALLGGGLA